MAWRVSIFLYRAARNVRENRLVTSDPLVTPPPAIGRSARCVLEKRRTNAAFASAVFRFQYAPNAEDVPVILFEATDGFVTTTGLSFGGGEIGAVIDDSPIGSFA